MRTLSATKAPQITEILHLQKVEIGLIKLKYYTNQARILQ